MKLAVFGHYDSRGGTTAIELPDKPTEADIAAAKDRYNREAFGMSDADITEEGNIRSTAYGMPARACDQIVDKMLRGSNLPGDNDFMYVAELDATYVPESEDGYGIDIEDLGAVLLSKLTPEDGPDPVWLKFVPYPIEFLSHPDPIPASWFEARGKWEESLTDAEWEYKRWDDDAFGFMLMRVKESGK